MKTHFAQSFLCYDRYLYQRIHHPTPITRDQGFGFVCDLTHPSSPLFFDYPDLDHDHDPDLDPNLDHDHDPDLDPNLDPDPDLDLDHDPDLDHDHDLDHDPDLDHDHDPDSDSDLDHDDHRCLSHLYLIASAAARFPCSSSQSA
jgi:hypothetical protein